MAQNTVESIFNSKKNLSDFYPEFPGVSIFDLENKHLFYGRMDKEGDAIYLDDSNLKQLRGGTSQLAVDFVCEAFSDLKKNIKSAADKGFVSKNSLYPANLTVFKSWPNGDMEYNYNQYLNKLYKTFVNSYLSVARRANKIKNYKDFVREFLRFVLRTAEYFPVTKTSFITSIHCSPYVSGLMLEVTQEQHGIENNARVLKYINDLNFSFFVNEVKKFGFMVDKNAPWRIVFNIASGHGMSLGGEKYMNKFAVNFDNVFETYYRKAYLDELVNLKNKFYSLYDAFYSQFNSYENLKHVTAASAFGRCPSIKMINERLPREPPPLFDTGEEINEYWLKILLKLRMVETKTEHTPHNFNFYAMETIRLYRLFGLEAGLKYINELTKGLHVTTFLSKGSFWYGMPEKEYEQKKLKTIQNAENPSLVDYSLTGTKNVK
jgi:hypothetical protein